MSTPVDAEQDPHMPLRGGCWVASGEGASLSLARVKACYRVDGRIVLDLQIHDTEGNNLGRTSPSLDGPRTFEPACDLEGWRRIAPPRFPLQRDWMPSPDDPARRVLGYVGIETIPFGRFLSARAAEAWRESILSRGYDARRLAAQERRDLARALATGTGAACGPPEETVDANPRP